MVDRSHFQIYIRVNITKEDFIQVTNVYNNNRMPCGLTSFQVATWLHKGRVLTLLQVKPSACIYM